MRSFSDMGEVFQDPTVRFFGSEKPGSQSDMKMIHVDVGYIFFLDGFPPFYGHPWMFMFLVAIKCPCFDGASMWEFFVEMSEAMKQTAPISLRLGSHRGGCTASFEGERNNWKVLVFVVPKKLHGNLCFIW